MGTMEWWVWKIGEMGEWVVGSEAVGKSLLERSLVISNLKRTVIGHSSLVIRCLVKIIYQHVLHNFEYVKLE
jgi:hypothetical protein